MNRLARAAFIVYALILVVATHIPKLEVRGPVERPDLWIHVAAFGLWTVLFFASQIAGPRTAWRAVALTSIVSLAWAGLDEWSQQFFQRVTAADDFAANAAGVWIGSVIAAVWCAGTRRASGTP